MGYTHYFHRKKDVPDSQWKDLCKKLKEAFKLLPNHDQRDRYGAYPLTIHDLQGKKHIANAKDLFVVIDGVNMIMFNGDASQQLRHEGFALNQKEKQGYEDWFCKTACKPYDFLVTAVLILTENICLDCFDISSDGNKEEWLPVLNWLNESLNAQYQLPANI